MRVCEIELSHMGKHNGNPDLVCEKTEDFTRVLLLLQIKRIYITAHVFLNALNELGISDKMRGLPRILSFFRNEFNKISDTGGRMLDSVYHMTFLFCNLVFGMKTSSFGPTYSTFNGRQDVSIYQNL